MTEFEKLEKNKSLTILATLYTIGNKTYHSELRKKAQIGINTLDKRLFELRSIGLIEEEIEDKFGGRRYIWLTPKGKRVAEKLVEIEDILKEK